MDIYTTGDIAHKLEADRDAVAYALRKSHVEPIGRAGLVRLFPDSALDTVRDFLQSKRRPANRREGQV